MPPIIVIARLTFLEAARRRILLAGLLLGLAFLALFGTGFYFITADSFPDAATPIGALLQRQVFNFLANGGMYAINFLTLAMAAMISADTLAGEINSGTIQAVATKPITRLDIVLGKWLGLAGLLALYLLLMAGGILLIVYLLSGFIPPNVPIGLMLILLNSLLIMSITLACSTAFSTLATGGVVFGLYGLAFIGGWVEQVGAVANNATAVDVGILSSLIIPSEALFRLAAYQMTSEAARAMGMMFGPVFVISVPSAMMAVYAVLYVVVMVALAVRHFSQRDL